MSGSILERLSPASRRLVEEASGRADRALTAITGQGPEVRLFVPGRIEVLGKHTDYAGGRSLTCAAERGFALAARIRSDATVRIVDARDGRDAVFTVAPDLTPPIGHWSNYPMTVARRLARNFPGISAGADIAFFSNLPKAAGLSTSSALVTAVYLLLSRANNIADRPEYASEIGTPFRLAGYLGSIENGQAFATLSGDHGVGTFGGSEDHTAILLSEAGRLGCYRYRPVSRTRQLVLPADLVFVIGTSGIAADKTGSARDRYNRASMLVTALLARWKGVTGREDETLADALAAGPDAATELRDIASNGNDPLFPAEHLRKRLEHFLLEDGVLLPAALDALASEQRDVFGSLVDRSQQAAGDLLGNQVPETITLARQARELGAIAASGFGAGFGGSVWALVEFARAEPFLEAWRQQYTKQHPAAAAQSTFFTSGAGPGAGLID